MPTLEDNTMKHFISTFDLFTHNADFDMYFFNIGAFFSLISGPVLYKNLFDETKACPISFQNIKKIHQITL